MSEKHAASGGKDVLYIDVDDEITAIIDKLQASKQKIVALVLPKRATVLQSIVNMKLLKRGADAAHKNLVLITSEAGLLPLAGAVGVHVARSLQSKPEIPDAPGRAAAESDYDAAEDEPLDADAPSTPSAASRIAGRKSSPPEPDDSALDKTRTVGELAGAAALDDQLEEDDNIDLDNDAEDPELTPAATGKPQKGKDKKLKVPNFNKFRIALIFGAVGVIALGVLLYFMFAVMPKAAVAIKTDSQAVNSSGAFVLKTGAGVTLDKENSIMPATQQSVQKNATQQVAASGQKNNGEKADGTVKISNCTSSPVTIPAGSGVSAGGLTFITQTNLSLSDGNFTSGGNCKTSGSHIGTVAVVAQQAGTQYNVAARSDYAVSGFPGVSGAGSAMTGGTDNITKIVTQADIDSAKQKLASADTNAIKQELKSALIAKDLYAVDVSFAAANPDIKTSANAGDAADNVTVTQTTTYTMLGLDTADLEAIIADEVKDKIDTKKQKILDYGLDDLTLDSQAQQSTDGATFSYQTTVVVGSELNEESIKKQVAGKKAGEAERIIKQNPGVTEVEVTYSPFWVSKIPGNPAKITVTVEKPTAASKRSNAGNP